MKEKEFSVSRPMTVQGDEVEVSRTSNPRFAFLSKLAYMVEGKERWRREWVWLRHIMRSGVCVPAVQMLHMGLQSEMFGQLHCKMDSDMQILISEFWAFSHSGIGHRERPT